MPLVAFMVRSCPCVLFDSWYNQNARYFFPSLGSHSYICPSSFFTSLLILKVSAISHHEFADFCVYLYWHYDYFSLYWHNDFILTAKFKNCPENIAGNAQEGWWYSTDQSEGAWALSTCHLVRVGLVGFQRRLWLWCRIPLSHKSPVRVNGRLDDV